MDRTLYIHAGRLITPRSELHDVTIVAREGTILDILPGAIPAPDGEPFLEAGSHIVGPGLIDLHVHGGGGHDTMDGIPQALLGLSAFHARHGTTALLPSTVAASAEQIDWVLAAFPSAMAAPVVGARILGAHVEGPFLNPAKRGAHLARYVRAPAEPPELWLEAHRAAIRRLTLAPELPGALELTKALRRQGVLVSIGHSTADEEMVARSALAGATHVTHLFNAMTTMEKVGALRRAGLAEAALASDEMTVEVIADGWHVPFSVLKLVVRAKGPERVALVTDAMRAAGLPAGRYDLGGMGVTVQDGHAITDEGGLAGSIATMSELLRNAVHRVGIPLANAWRMCSLTPAQILGESNRLGQVAVGHAADLLVLDDDLQVVATIVDGHIVYERGKG